MLKNNNIIAVIITVAFFLVSGTCFAIDSSVIYNSNEFLKPSDVSLQLLSNMFGMIPGIPQFIVSKKTIIGSLFYAFNWGLFGISGIFLCYTTIKLIAETSLEGGQMKGNMTAMWTVLRVVCGVGLLIPTESGYSTANTVVMWVILQSISLANWTWYNVLMSFDTGTGLNMMSIQENKEQDALKQNTNLLKDKLANSIDYGDARIGTTDILRSLVCAEAVKQALSKVRTSKNMAVNGSSISKVETYFCKENNECQLPFIKGADDPNNKKSLFELIFPNSELGTTGEDIFIKDQINSVKANEINGICGSFKVASDTSSNSSGAQYLKQVMGLLDVEAKRLVKLSADERTKKTIDPFTYVVNEEGGDKIFLARKSNKAGENPEQDKYVNKYFITEPKNTEEQKKLLELKIPSTAQELLTAAALYYQLSKPAEANHDQQIIKDRKQAKTEQLNQGWAVAGSYYRGINAEIEKQTREIEPYTITDPERPNAKRAPYPGASLFFASDIQPPVILGENRDVAYLFNKIDIATGKLQPNPKVNGESYTAFAHVMEWVYFMPAYAKFLRYNLEAKPMADTDIKATSPLKVFEYRINTEYGALLASQASGGVLLCIPLTGPAAIPLLAMLPTGFMNIHIGKIINKWKAIMVSGKTSTITLGVNATPIEAGDAVSKLQLLGHVVIEESWNYFMEMKALLLTVGVGYGASSIVNSIGSTIAGIGTFWGATVGVSNTFAQYNVASSALDSMVRGLISSDMAMGMAMFAPLLTIGLTLSIYVPLIPYMLFLFGVVSWLISVVCLMFAAPIICFLMLWSGAAQENPLLSKEAELFVTQLLAAFLRPALMVAGLVVGVVVCNISVNLLNYGFDSILLNSMITKNSSFELIERIEGLGGIIIYTFVMISLVNMSFSTIHVLYTEVMRLLQIQLGSVTGTEAETQMQQVKQGTEGLAQAGAGGVKDSATAMKDIHIQAKQNDKLNEKNAAEQVKTRNKS